MVKQLVYIIILFCGIVHAQKIDHLVSYRDIFSSNYFRFNYDNDYFAASDENYTQGYNFELVMPVLSKNPVNTILFKLNNSELRYGLSLEHIGFTPDNYDLPDIQFGDRPFAAAIMLKSFNISSNLDHKIRMHSSVNIGIIGPGAFGEEMQVEIHRATGNKTPRGWKQQIKNDVVLNYSIGIEKQVLGIKDLVSVKAQSNLNIGTLFTNASVGANVMIGKFQNSFSSTNQNRKFQIYTYFQSVFTGVAYDATLQGGLINNDSPYTIASEDIERLTNQHNLGIVVQTRTLYFEYTRSIISKEFSTGSLAKWGGIRVGFTF